MMDNTKAVMKIMAGLADRSRGRLARIREKGRVGMLFAAIKDIDGDLKGEAGFRARIEHILYLARSGEAEQYYGFGAIQVALAVRSWDMWEELWREKYPDRGDEWETGFDHNLMRPWRERVRDLFTEHHQEGVFSMRVADYIARLLEDGLDERSAGELAIFFKRAFLR